MSKSEWDAWYHLSPQSNKREIAKPEESKSEEDDSSEPTMADPNNPETWKLI